MEAIVAIPSPDRGRELVLPLSMGGIRVRAVLQTGTQLINELTREPADALVLAETLPDGPAEVWLARVAGLGGQRPAAVVLVYGVEGGEAVRERARAAYGPAAEVVAAGARPAAEVAAEAARVLDALARTVADQDRAAYERLRQPVPSGTVPQPVRTSGALALLGMSGGVGTSTLAVNLAFMAAMAGQRVLLVDAQFATAGSHLHYLGVEPDEDRVGMHHLRWSHIGGANAPREEAVEQLMPCLVEVRNRSVRHAELRVLHVPALLQQMAEMPVEQVIWAIEVLERSFDLTLVDCGTGLGSARTLRLLEQAGRILLLAGGWGAGVHALARGLSALDAATSVKIDSERILLLLRDAGEGAYGARTVSDLVKMPIFGRLPEEPLIRKAESRLGVQMPLVAEAPDAPYTRSVAQLAYALGIASNVEPPAARRRGLFGIFRRRR